MREADETQASATKLPPTDFPALKQFATIRIEHMQDGPPDRLLEGPGILVFNLNKDGKIVYNRWVGDDGRSEIYNRLRSGYKSGDTVTLTGTLRHNQEPALPGMEQGVEYSVRAEASNNGANIKFKPL